MKWPAATLYPPVHENLSYYKKLLKNIPLRSGEEYQNFLNATSVDNSRTQDGETGPLNSTQNTDGRGQSFWRRFSFTRKSYRVNPEPRDKDLEMNRILPRNEPMASNTASSPQNTPNSITNENTLVNDK